MQYLANIIQRDKNKDLICVIDLELNPSMIPLVEFGHQALIDKGFPVGVKTSKDCVLEFHDIQVTHEEGGQHPFVAHRDDDPPKKVETCTIYTHVSKDMKGGDLLIHDVLEEDSDKQSESKTIDRIRPQAGRMVLMSGDIPHSIEPFDGPCVRQCFVMTFSSARA